MTPPDPTPIEALLAESDWLRRLARRLVRDEQRADDAVQDTLVAALQSPPRASSAPRAWLSRVLRNAVLQEQRGAVRRRRREAEVAAERSGAGPSSHDVAERLELQRSLVEAVQELDEPVRTAVVLRFLDGLPPREIARRTGAPVKTVHSRLERGVARLRSRLNKDYPGRWVAVLLPWIRGGAGTLLAPLASSPLAKAGLAVLVAAGLFVGVRQGLSGDAAAPVPAAWSEPEPQDVVPDSEPLRAPPQDERTEEAPVTDELQASVTDPPSAAPGPRAVLFVDVQKSGSGEPVDAAVIARGARGGFTELLAAGRTLDRGAARLEVPADTEMNLTVAPQDLPPDAEPVGRWRGRVAALAEGEERRLTVALPHGLDATFFGRVVDGEGRSLSGAKVQPMWNAGGRVETDGEGRFDVRHAAWQGSDLLIEHEAYGPAFLALRGQGTSPAEPFVIELARAAAVEAWVRDPGGSPEGLAVRLVTAAAELAQPRGERVRGEFARTAECDAAGRADLAGLPADAPFQVEVRRGEELVHRVSAPLVLAPGERRVLELDLGAGAEVTGLLLDVDGGAPVADHEVWLLLAGTRDPLTEGKRYFGPDDRGRAAFHARTDARGAFRIAGVPPGDWWIGPAALPHSAEPGPDAVAPLAVPLALREGERSSEVELRARRGGFIEGRLEVPAGYSLRGVRVYAQLAGGFGSVAFRLDGERGFRLGPVADELHYVHAWSLETMGTSNFVPARPGEEDLVLALGTGSTVAGRLVLADGTPTDGRISLVAAGRGSSTTGTGALGRGVFEFSDLREGSYTLCAWTPEGLVAVHGPLELAGGREVRDVELVLERGAAVSLSLAPPHGSARCEVTRDGLVIANFTLRREAPEVLRVPAGAVLVRLYAGDEFLDERALQLGPGEQRDLRMGAGD